MTNVSQKLNLGSSINRSVLNRSHDVAHGFGRGLPATLSKVAGGIVTSNFEMQSGWTLPKVEMPLFGAEYVRLPMQEGDRGVTLGLDAAIDNVSGLGSSAPQSYTRPGNLGASVFMPVAHKEWESTKPNFVVMYGVKPKNQQAQDQTHGVSLYDQVPSKAKAFLHVQKEDSGSKVHADVEGTKLELVKDKATILKGGSKLELTGDTTVETATQKIKKNASKILLNC